MTTTPPQLPSRPTTTTSHGHTVEYDPATGQALYPAVSASSLDAAASSAPATATRGIGEAERLLAMDAAQVTDAAGQLRALGELEVYLLNVQAPNSHTPLHVAILMVPGHADASDPEQAFQLPLAPQTTVEKAHSDAAATAYKVRVPDVQGEWQITLPTPTPGAAEQLQGLEDIFRHYTSFTAPAPADVRGTVALVSASGAVVGTLAASQALDASKLDPSATGPVVVAPTAPGMWTVAEPATPADVAAAHAAQASGATAAVSLENRMITTAETVGDMLLRAATFTAAGITRGAVALRDGGYVAKGEKDATISPQTLGNIETAKKVSAGAVQVTGAIVAGAVSAAAAVGSVVASRVQTSSPGSGDKADTRTRTIKLTSALIKSLAVLGDRASTSGRIVLRATGDGAATLVEHKYGQQAGKAVRDVSDVAENLYVVYVDSRGFKRAVLLTGAKSTVHELAGGKDKLVANPNAAAAAAAAAGASAPAIPARATTASAPAPVGASSAGSLDALATSAMSAVATHGPKVASAVQTHAPKVAAAVATHGPKVAAAVAQGAYVLWTKASEQLAQQQAAGQQAAGASTAHVPVAGAAAVESKKQS